MKMKALRDYPELSHKAAIWFNEKWEVPVEEYKKSIDLCIKHKIGVPQWYVMLDEEGGIVAGAGVIENDFHDRKDLVPNLCALFVEESYRGKGIGKEILDFVRRDFGRLGFEKLYLITDHIGFYEKYGWEFVDMVVDDEGRSVRMYGGETLMQISK